MATLKGAWRRLCALSRYYGYYILTRKLFNKTIANIIACIHLILIFGNIISIFFLIVYSPFYIWMPIVTVLCSPVLGGTYCFLNRMENTFRLRAGMPYIKDRLSSTFKIDKGDI